MKRVISLVQESEAVEKPLEDVEVTQPQPSPIKTQTPQPQVQIQTLQTQTLPLPETQTSSTAQHQSQKSPLSPQEEETGSSFQIPEMPLLHVDPVEAYTTFQPFQSQQIQPPPTEAIQISETPEASSSSQSPSSSAATADTAQTTGELTIIPQFAPPTVTAEMQAIDRYLRDREQAEETIKLRYSNVPWTAEFFTQTVDFLTYITYRGTEYYKIYRLMKAFKEAELIQLEAKLLNFIGVNGFHDFLDGTSFWDKLDAKVKEAYPTASFPKREPTLHEKRLMRMHAEEVEVKDAEIASLHSEITRMSEEMEKRAEEVISLREDFDRKKKELEGKVEEKERLLGEKEKALEAQVKLVGDQVKIIAELKQMLDAERNRLKELNSRMVNLEKEKSTLISSHKEEMERVSKYAEKMIRAMEDKDGELVMMNSKMARAAIQIAAQAKEIDSVNLKKAELAEQINQAQERASELAVKIVEAAQLRVTLNNQEIEIATARAELEASQDFWYFNLQEERRLMKEEIEAELDARFREVESLERMMVSVVEREKQCKYLLDEISMKTADIVLSEEHIFATKTEKMLHALFNKFEELSQSLSGKTIVPTPGSDDAKKGEGQVKQGGVGGDGGSRVVMELIEGGRSDVEGAEEADDEARALSAMKGKVKLTEEELMKKPEEPSRPVGEKVLGASIARHPPVTVLTKEERRKQMEDDETMARELERLFELKKQTAAGASSSEAPASAAAPASSAALASTTAGVTSSAVVPPTSKKDMPPPPPPKPPLKRTAPETKGDDPAAKRQKAKQAVASRTQKEERKRKEREEGRSEGERKKRIKARRLQVIDARIEEYFSEVLLIQSSLVRSAFIPFMPDESEACEAQAISDACDVTTKEMVESGRYPRKEEQNYIRKRLNEKRPMWSSESGKKFTEIMTELSKRSEEELAKRRNEHPDAREIEDFIPRDLRDQWLYYKDLFIKAYYYWEVVPLQDRCSRISALSNFLATYDEKLRRKIFTTAELAQPKPLVIKIPALKDFPMPYHPGTDIPDRGIIDEEVNEAFKLESAWRPSIHTVGSMESRVLSAYEDTAAKRKEEERKEKEEKEKDEAAGNP